MLNTVTPKIADIVGRRMPMSEALSTPRRVDATTTAATAVRNYDTIVIGAGPTGLGAAYHLDRNTLLLDKNPTIGGGCRSITDDGFTFDCAEHILFSDDPSVQELYRLLLGDNIHWQTREAWIHTQGGYTRYPIQDALCGLPPKVLKECGLQALMDGFLLHIKGDIQLNALVTAISPTRRIVTLSDGRQYRYRDLISTMPLPELINAMGEQTPIAVREAAKALRYVSVRCVNLGVARENVTDKHCIYYPEEPLFHRVFAQGNASPHCNPPGGFGLTCEVSYSAAKPLPLEGRALIERCRADCVRVGLLRADDRLITANEVDIPYAYVVHDHIRARNVSLIRNWLDQYDIFLAGRYGEWEHHNADHAFIAGKKVAQTVKENSFRSQVVGI